MQILLINNTGAGYADRIEVPDGMTVAALFQAKMPGAKPDDFLVRVNRQPVTADEALTPGCRVSITPTKIAGATGTAIHRQAA
jgi:sulfur carrier protein ThiS